MKYTVLGIYMDDEPVVAGVIEGEHGCVDSEPSDPQRWATSVEAPDPDQAERKALYAIRHLGLEEEDEAC